MLEVCKSRRLVVRNRTWLERWRACLAERLVLQTGGLGQVVKVVAGEWVHRVACGLGVAHGVDARPGAAGQFVAEAVHAVVATAFFGSDVPAVDVVVREQVAAEAAPVVGPAEPAPLIAGAVADFDGAVAGRRLDGALRGRPWGAGAFRRVGSQDQRCTAVAGGIAN